MSDESELTPLLCCPFCGSHVLEMDRFNWKGQRPNHWFITCYQCPNEGITAKTRDKAIAVWNTRAT